MKRFFKKAFTLVELLVVIAIIAVLAVVGIVSYSAFTKKAELSNDVGLITQINTVLQADEAAEGKNHTFHDVRADVLENGIDLAKIKLSSSDLRLAWDSAQDRTVLLRGDEIIKPDGYEGGVLNDMFVVAENVDEVKAGTTYNFYLPDGFDATGLDTVQVGIDVGNNANIDINYVAEGGGKRIFNTNGGTLTVNNPDITVNHYGTAKVAEIIAVADDSYHCYAEIVGSINVAQGHVVVENTADVPLINVVRSENAAATVKVEYKPEAKQDIPVIVAQDVNENALTKEDLPATALTVDLSGKVDTDSSVDYGDAVAISTYKANDGNNKVHTYTAEEFQGATANFTTNPLHLSNCAAGGTTEITLLNNVELDYGLKMSNGVTSSALPYNIVLNLNGFELKFPKMKDDSTTRKNAIYLQMGTDWTNPVSLTVKNGKFQIESSMPGIAVYDGCSLSVEDIECNFTDGNGSNPPFYALGDANHETTTKMITVKNSVIDSKSYGLATNAGTDANWEPQFVVENSTIVATWTPIMINVPGEVNISNSKLTGGYQAVCIRGGNATITDSELTLTMESGYEDCFDNMLWGDSVNANYAVLTIGNKSTSYQYATNVTITGCKLTATNTGYDCIYAWANKDANTGVTLNYSNCTFNSKVRIGGKAPTSQFHYANTAEKELTDNESAYFADNHGLTQMVVNGVSYAGQTPDAPIVLYAP